MFGDVVNPKPGVKAAVVRLLARRSRSLTTKSLVWSAEFPCAILAARHCLPGARADEMA